MRTLDLRVRPAAIEDLLRPRPATDPDVDRVVAGILAGVQEGGDAALLRYARRFDSVDLSRRGLRVGSGEITTALAAVSRESPRTCRTRANGAMPPGKPYLAAAPVLIFTLRKCTWLPWSWSRI